MRTATARKGLKISQTTVAERIGKAQSTVGGYETGDAEPNVADWVRLAEILGTTPEWLAFGRGNANPSEDEARLIEWIIRHKEDELLLKIFSSAAAMLNEEGLKFDLPFLFRLTVKLTEKAKSLRNNFKIGERVSRTIESERAEIRKELDAIRKKRL